MFQDFTVTARPEQGPPRLAALRKTMSEQGLDAFLVPRADAYQGEYVSDRDARLQWLTGFTGSAGICVVTAQRAAVFADGRYTLQARAQCADDFEIVDFPAERPGPWLADILPESSVVGLDPWLHTRAEVEALDKALAPRNIALRPVDNPVDVIWDDQPGPPLGAVSAYPDDLAGASRAEKCARIAKDLRDAGQDWAVLSLPDSIAWLLNIRGSDIPRIPVAHGFALVEAAGGAVRLFMAHEKLRDVEMDGVDVLPPDGLVAALAALDGVVRVDRDSAPHAVGLALENAGSRVDWAPDPCMLPKACKSAAEIAATTEAHLRDGAAMCAFLAWLDGRLDGVTQGEILTEIDVAAELEGFRRATNALRDISFDTIAGTGPNGAITHYRVNTESNRTVATGDLLLVDSGGQYVDGTTDITRTVAVGPPDAEQVAAFTRVLKGMIAVSRARWPQGLAGRDLDALARAPLWMAGQDYGHGTGHGVGVYLSVHEGPQRLSRMSEEPLRPGMILSNEPGYYRAGAWGIRIENLVVVRPAPPIDGGDPGRDMLDFDTLTWVPIDRRLIDAGALSPGERAWIDDYHAGVYERLAQRVEPGVADWLRTATAPL